MLKMDERESMGNTEYNGGLDSIPKCIRKVSNTERVFLWNPNCNVSMIARIRGDISEEKLVKAMETVRHMHPLVGAKIIFDEDHNGWFSTDDVPQPSFKIVNRLSDSQWFEELQQEIKTPFNLEDGPMIRFILIYSPEVSDLVIICNHSICDGMSLVYLVRDLLRSYMNHQQKIKVLSPPNIMEFLPKQSFSLSSILARFFIHYANMQWKKRPYYFDHKDYTALQNAYWEKNMFGTVLLELKPHETKALSKSCKKSGVTIGSAVTTAFIAAHHDIVGPFIKNQKQISVPFDLRRHTNGQVGDVFCLCVGAPRFSYSYDTKKSFWENAGVLHNEIHKRVEKLDSEGLEVPDVDPTLMDALSCFAFFEKIVPEAYVQTDNLLQFSQDKKNIAFSIAKRSENMLPGTIPSNLGRINIPDRYGNLQIDQMIFLPAVSDTVPLTLGGISICDKMVFSLNYPEKDADEPLTPKMIQIRNKALEYLGFPDNATGNRMIG